MTTDAICEERKPHWSQQVSAMATTQWLQRDQTLPICERCSLQDHACTKYHLEVLYQYYYSMLYL